MSNLHIIVSLIIVLICNSNGIVQDDEDLFVLNLTVTNYNSTKEDEIIFAKFQLPDEELTIVGYTPLVVTPTAHHMNTVACQTPFSTESLWTEGTTCGSGAQMLLYGWDRDALPFRLPQDVGIVVGKNTPYKYIVVNIHYLPIVTNDYSGNQFIFSRKRRQYLAGIVSGGPEPFSLLPKTQNIKTPFSCQYHGTQLWIFAVGIHAHQWARVNTLYRVRNQNITLIAKVNPQQSHQTYQLSSRVEILDGDYLVGQCIFDNDQNRTILTGLTHKHEMCNFMAGYLYERNDHLQIDDRVPLDSCWSNPFPHLIHLIPADSEIPLKTSFHGNQTDSLDATLVSTSPLLIILFNFYTAWFMIIIVTCLFTIKSLHNLFIVNKSIANLRYNCFNRSDGFQPIQQFSDGENDI